LDDLDLQGSKVFDIENSKNSDWIKYYIPTRPFMQGFLIMVQLLDFTYHTVQNLDYSPILGDNIKERRAQKYFFFSFGIFYICSTSPSRNKA
jgi:hypothetical protein